MKIGLNSELPASVSQTTPANVQKTAQGAAETAKSAGTSAGVSVSVSTLARSLDKPEVTTSGVFDTAKVNAVKTAIQNGTYKVNPEAIADKLLSNAQEMLDRSAL